MTEQAAWAVEFFCDARGKDPVREFIDGLPKGDQAKLFRALTLLQEFGPMLGRPHVAPIEGKLQELRAGPGRVFFFTYTGRRIILLHGYRKKSQRTPGQEIETARRRMADFLMEEGAQ